MGRDRAGGTSQENDVDPGRYLSFAGRCTVEIAPSSGPVSLYIDIRVSPSPPPVLSVYRHTMNADRSLLVTTTVIRYPV